MFYNTGIATYVWVLTNRKPEHRRGKVQLIDATGWHRPLRKNLGKKNCELGEEDIARICDTFLAFEKSEQSKILDNAAFGYSKVTMERPLRIEGADPNRAYKAADIKKLKENGERSETAPPVIRKIHKRGTDADPLRGRFAATINGRLAVVEYEPDTDLRDTEQIPLQQAGGIEAFLQGEVLPYAADAWYEPDSVGIGFEISFNRYFYKPKPMRTLAEIRADIVALEKETEGLLLEILTETTSVIANLRPYPKMKESGIDWLGRVPEHWELRRLGASIDDCVNGVWGADPDDRHNMVCVRVADFDRVRRRVDMSRKTIRAITQRERRRRLLNKGDLLIEMSGGGNLQPVGAVVMYDHDAPAVCSNFVARMSVAPNYDPTYLTYLHSCIYERRLNTRSIKQTTGIQNLDSYLYLSERSAFPPPSEQTAIGRFLDHTDRRLQRYVRARKQLIALLYESDNATIYQAVTGQIDVCTGRPYLAL